VIAVGRDRPTLCGVGDIGEGGEGRGAGGWVWAHFEGVAVRVHAAIAPHSPHAPSHSSTHIEGNSSCGAKDSVGDALDCDAAGGFEPRLGSILVPAQLRQRVRFRAHLSADFDGDPSGRLSARVDEPCVGLFSPAQKLTGSRLGI
jgi:hypothetical protein